MRRARIVSITAAVIAAAIAFTPGASAMNDGLAALKARDHLAIEGRLTVLNGLTHRVDSATHLTSSHRSTLLAQYSSAESGLKALDQKIQSDTTLSSVRADQATIVTGYRVYVLIVPKTHIVIASDRTTFIASELSKLEAKLAKAVDKAPAGQNKTDAAAALADMQKQIAAATDAVSGVASSVLPLTASGYPGNRSILLSARAGLVEARTALRAARADAATVIAKLS
jgi:hypothetical protein